MSAHEIWVQGRRRSLLASFGCASIDDLSAVDQHRLVMHVEEQRNATAHLLRQSRMTPTSPAGGTSSGPVVEPGDPPTPALPAAWSTEWVDQPRLCRCVLKLHISHWLGHWPHIRATPIFGTYSNDTYSTCVRHCFDIDTGCTHIRHEIDISSSITQRYSTHLTIVDTIDWL